MIIRRSSSDYVIRAVYVDDILLTESDIDGIKKAKDYLETVCDQIHGETLIFFWD